MRQYRQYGAQHSSWLLDDAGDDRRWFPAILQGVRGRRSAREVAAEIGWTERHLRRQLTFTFGFSFGTLVRISRAREALSLIDRGMPLASTASLAGYSDQAHMTREFGRFVGSTPGQVAGRAA